MRGALRCAAPAMLVAALALAPFLGKAFTIDDTLFLRQAEQVLRDWRHPTAFEMVWSEAPLPRRMSEITPNGPAMAYLLAPVVASGAHEWLAHVEQFAFLALAIVSTAALALRLGCAPRVAAAAALLLACTPAALAMAGTAMPDVPAMALGVLGVERLVAWRDERRPLALAVAIAALALAPLARLHLLLLLAVAALLVPRDLFARGIWRAAAPAAWLALPPLLTLAALAWTRDPQAGATPWVDAGRHYSSLAYVGPNAVAWAVHWTLALPFSLPYALLRGPRLVHQPLAWVAVGGLAIVALATPGGASSLWVAPVVGVTVAALSDVFVDALSRRDSTQLALGTWLLVPLALAPYIHLPPKYLLAAAPAAAILVARAAVGVSARRATAVVGASALAGLVLGVLILRADAALAGLGRRAAEEWIAPRVAAGSSVWFAGHWGFQWYAERAGAHPLTLTPPLPRAGDLVVSSARAYGDTIELVPKRRQIAQIEDEAPGGRIMSFRLGAGFYSNFFGLLPWAYGAEPSDRLDLWEVEGR